MVEGLGVPCCFISISREKGSCHCALTMSTEGLTDKAQDGAVDMTVLVSCEQKSCAGILVLEIVLDVKILSLDAFVTRAPVRSVLSGFEPSNVIVTNRPLDSLTCTVVRRTYQTYQCNFWHCWQ